MTKARYDFKILLVGDGGVGKTSLLIRYIDNMFSFDYMNTIGVQFMKKIIHINDITINLVIWDISGQSKFTDYRHIFFKQSKAVILVYDITNADSFKNLNKYWLNDVREFSGLKTQIIIVGNKIDLNESRKVKKREGKKFSKINDAMFLETSAKTGENVNILFEKIAIKILEKMNKPQVQLIS